MHARRALSILAILCLLVTSIGLAQGGPGERKEPALKGAPGAQFLDVAVSNNGQWVIGVTTDPGSRMDTPIAPGAGSFPDYEPEYEPGDGPDVDVWHLWRRSGTLRDFNSADPADCIQSLDPSETCQTDAELVAISADGQRFVIGSNLGGSPPTSMITILGQDRDPRIVELAGALTHLALDDDGRNFFALTQQTANLQTTTTLHAYEYLVSDGEATWTRTGLAGAPSDLDISRDGHRILVAADQPHRFVRSQGGSPSTGSNSDGNPLAVAIADVAPYWGIVAYQSGSITLYQDDNPTKFKFRDKPTAQRETAAAITDVGDLAIIGDAVGTLRLFVIDKDADNVLEMISEDNRVTGRVDDIEISADGRYALVVATTSSSGSADKSTVHLFRIHGDRLDRLWSDARGVPVTSASIDAVGDAIAVVANGKVVFYEAQHDLRVTAGASPTIAPLARGHVDLHVRNQGNRDEQVNFTIDGPGTWFLNLSAGAVDLLQAPYSLGLNQNITARAGIVVPDAEAPGAYPVWVNYTAASGATGSRQFTVTVPVLSDFVLDIEGPTSQSVQAGSFATYPVLVKNNGNTALATAITATVDRDGWTASPAPASVEVASGASKTVHIDVRAPTGAAELETATITVGLSEAPGQVVTLTATVDASFQPTLEAPSSVRVPIGGVGAFNVTVSNDGNARDSFVVTAGSLPAGWSALVAADEGSTVIRDVEAGDEVTIEIRVTPASDASSAVTVPMLVQATSQGDGTRSSGKNVLLGLTEADDGGGEPPEENPPGVGAVMLLALLGSMAVAARRHTRRAP